MSWKFWKRESNPMDPEQLPARGYSQPNSFPDPRPQDTLPVGAFGMTVEDVFSITGRGTVVTGRVTSGTVAVGDRILLSRAGQPLEQLEVTGLEMFRKIVKVAKAGDNVGLLLRGIQRDQVLKGDVLSK